MELANYIRGTLRRSGVDGAGTYSQREALSRASGEKICLASSVECLALVDLLFPVFAPLPSFPSSIRAWKSTSHFQSTDPSLSAISAS